MTCPHGKKYSSQCGVCNPRSKKPCSICGDATKKHSYGKKGDSERRCVNCKLADDINLNKKTCEDPNCSKGPTFGLNGKAVVCADHNLHGWPSVKKTCGCPANKIVSFGSPLEKRMLRCGSCKLDSDVNLRNKACHVCGSQKTSARYGPKGGGKSALKCYSCKADTDVNLIASLCTVCALIQPSFGTIGTKKALRCYKCQIDGDVVVLPHKKCVDCGKTRATYGLVEDRIPMHCGACADQSVEVDLNKKRCVVCHDVRPIFGQPGGEALRCESDRILGDIDLCSRLCVLCPLRENFDGRCKRAIFSASRDKNSRYCFQCKPLDSFYAEKDSCIVCKKRKATFGNKEDGIALRCKEHSLNEDTDVVNAKCERCFSGVRPIFGLPGDIVGSWCSGCKVDGVHVDVHNPMCIDCGEHRAIYGLASDKKRMYCRACSEKHSGQFECVVLKKCLHCEKCAIQDGFCTTCHPDYIPTISSCSKAACFFFDALEVELGVSIQHAHFDRTIGEWKRDEYNSKRVSGYSPIDGFIDQTNTVIEFEGDVFHGHPRLWQQDADAKNYFGVPYKTLYANTEKKLAKYLEAGYTVQYVWEHDLATKKKALDSHRSLLRTFDGKLHPRPVLPTGTKKRKATDGSGLLVSKKSKID